MTTLTQDQSVHIPDAGDAQDMAYCYASKKEREIEAFPLDPGLIAKYQEGDKECKKYISDKKFKFKFRQLEGHRVLSTEEGRLVVPKNFKKGYWHGITYISDIQEQPECTRQWKLASGGRL